MEYVSPRQLAQFGPMVAAEAPLRQADAIHHAILRFVMIHANYRAL